MALQSDATERDYAGLLSPKKAQYSFETSSLILLVVPWQLDAIKSFFASSM